MIELAIFGLLCCAPLLAQVCPHFRLFDWGRLHVLILGVVKSNACLFRPSIPPQPPYLCRRRRELNTDPGPRRSSIKLSSRSGTRGRHAVYSGETTPPRFAKLLASIMTPEDAAPPNSTNANAAQMQSSLAEMRALLRAFRPQPQAQPGVSSTPAPVPWSSNNAPQRRAQSFNTASQASTRPAMRQWSSMPESKVVTFCPVVHVWAIPARESPDLVSRPGPGPTPP